MPCRKKLPGIWKNLRYKKKSTVTILKWQLQSWYSTETQNLLFLRRLPRKNQCSTSQESRLAFPYGGGCLFSICLLHRALSAIVMRTPHFWMGRTTALRLIWSVFIAPTTFRLAIFSFISISRFHSCQPIYRVDRRSKTQHVRVAKAVHRFSTQFNLNAFRINCCMTTILIEHRNRWYLPQVITTLSMPTAFDASASASGISNVFRAIAS